MSRTVKYYSIITKLYGQNHKIPSEFKTFASELVKLIVDELVSDDKILFTKIRDVKSPSHGHFDDAGYDFYIPAFSENYANALLEKNGDNIIVDMDTQSIVVKPHKQIFIPSGIRVIINDKGTFLQVTNKSGVASKSNLDVMANTIDANFRGEMVFCLNNTSDNPIKLDFDKKIVQCIHRHYIRSEYTQISEQEYNYYVQKETEEADKEGVELRGEGGFGSTTLN